MPGSQGPIDEKPMDDEMIRRARGGDLDACGALYRLHAGRVYALVRRLVANEAQAEDWAQEVWLKVLRALPSFRAEARFTTWLHRIAVNTVLNGRRRNHRYARRFVDNEVVEIATRPDHPVLRLTLEEAIDTLPRGMRHVLVLHDVEGYTHEEIAAMVGITVGTSKSQLFKARAKLRQRLEPTSVSNEGEKACVT
jgi:RNA polymerase sigma-70 factor, ECF subfamily